jgi:hypothetical protein
MRRFLFLVLVFQLFVNNLQLSGQILEDTASLSIVKKGVACIYDFKFNEAKEILVRIDKLYPNHPIGFLFRGMIAYWQNYPLITSSADRPIYEKNMKKCIELCDKEVKPSSKAELLLINLCARGMLLMFYADNNLNLSVFPLASNTYSYLRHSFNFVSVYSDFFFFTGLYNYYREVYPDAHPVYRTFAFLFPKGDRNTGLEELRTAAGKSIVLRAESASFLSGIYLTYENNYNEASRYTEYLHNLYPDNIQYLAGDIKNLLLIKKYNEAEIILLEESGKVNNSYFRAQTEVFKGIIQEKLYKNLRMAEDYYKSGLSALSAYGEYGREYMSYAYFGLSRISILRGEKGNADTFRKKALNLADFKTVDFSD